MQRAYEVMYILRPPLEEEQIDVVLKKFEDFVVANGGSIVRHEKKGKKRLAYEVKDQREGHYVLLNLMLPPDQVKELKRYLMLSEEVIRHLIVQQESGGPIQPRTIQSVAAPAMVAGAPASAVND